MAAEGKNRWVVLLNKSPKGPLSESEIKTLLGQGILRLNDVAYQVNSDDVKESSEWKLLWQFPEFNRREKEGAGSKKAPVIPEGGDRRQKIAPEEIQKRALTELPPDLLEISPEDLIPKSTAITFSPEPERIAPMLETAQLRETAERIAPLDMRWVYAGVGVIFSSFVALNWMGPKESSNSSGSASSEPNRTPSQTPNSGSGRLTLPANSRRSSPPALPSPPAPILGRPLPPPENNPPPEADSGPEATVVDSNENGPDLMRPGEDPEEEAAPASEAPNPPPVPRNPSLRKVLRDRALAGEENNADAGDSREESSAGDDDRN